MTNPKYWSGTVKAKDDFGADITDEFVDGATIQGPWAIMSPRSHLHYGRGCGLGRGQRYVQQADGRWLKVEG